jgi:hypothetical protein
VVDPNQAGDVLYVLNKPSDKCVNLVLGHFCLTEHGFKALRKILQCGQVHLTNTLHDRVQVPVTNGNVERLDSWHSELMRLLDKTRDPVGNGNQVAELKGAVNHLKKATRMRRLACKVKGRPMSKVDVAPNLAGKEESAGTEQPSNFPEEFWVIRYLFMINE